MKIVTQGLSRLVFICGNYAIKIPWVNFVALTRVLIKSTKEKTFNEKRNRFGKSVTSSIVRYIFYILSSNRREFLFFKENKDKECLLPIIKTFFYGYIVIQPRGRVLKGTDSKWKKLLKKVEGKVNNIDLLKPENFCEFNGKIRLLDYASTTTQYELTKINFEVLLLNNNL